MSFFLPPPPQLFIQPDQMIKVQQRLQAERIQDFIVLAPSAAYSLKRWPLKHWFQLIKLNPAHQFVVLAGPHDDFTAELSTLPNVHNFTGQTTLLESAAMIQEARAVISNDTGLLHFAEQLGRPSIALMGPAPFGFPSRPSTRILERDLWCRPCSKHGQGPCVNPNFQECLKDISPLEVSLTLRTLLAEGHS